MAKNTLKRMLLGTLVLVFSIVTCTATLAEEDLVFNISLLGFSQEEFDSAVKIISDTDETVVINDTFKNPRSGDEIEWLVVTRYEPGTTLSLLSPTPQKVFFVDTAFVPGDSTIVDAASVWLSTLLDLAKQGTMVHVYVSDSDSNAVSINRKAFDELYRMSETDKDIVVESTPCLYGIKCDDGSFSTIFVNFTGDSYSETLTKAIYNVNGVLCSK